MKHFKAPKVTFGDIGAEPAAALIAAAADIALVIGSDGEILDLAVSSDELPVEWCRRWVGKPWIETVTVESRPKVEALLRDAATTAVSRRRHINHPASRGADLPILYSAVQLAPGGHMIAVGRDLQATAALQQRLVDVQQAMQRDQARQRNLGTRYRLLFEVTAEAVLMVDPATQKILEANPSAARLLGRHAAEMVGRTFLEGCDAATASAIQSLLAAVRASGRTEEIRTAATEALPELRVSASLFRQEGSTLCMVRVVPTAVGAVTGIAASTRERLLELADSAPDGLVVTARDGRIVAANAAFLELAQLATEEQARGESLERWLGRPGVDLNVLIANLRQHGSVRLYATTVRGEYGATSDIEVSAVTIAPGEETHLGFAIRNVGLRPVSTGAAGRELPRSVEQLTELVGRVPLKDLVRETTDVIERLCIEAALELTRDNRASAAEILGLSRQSLYVKLRRYGLGDLGAESEA